LLEKGLIASESYEDLWQWSVTHIPEFWFETFHFLHIKSDSPPTCADQVVDETHGMFPRPTWFRTTKLNFAENLLYPTPEIANPDTTVAIIEATEEGVSQRLTWTDLRVQVAQFTQALRAAGVTKGDRIGGNPLFVPINCRRPGKYGACGSSVSGDGGNRRAVVLYVAGFWRDVHTGSVIAD
jgi:Acetyl-coenzyme A synthetase N-terminus